MIGINFMIDAIVIVRFSKAFGGIFGSRVLPVFVGLSSFGFVGVSDKVE
jgi:hypothetical protein